MKITIAYTNEEERKAYIIKAFVCGLFGNNFKLRRSEKHKPFFHIYITTKNEKPTP